MNTRDELRSELEARLAHYEANIKPLRGIRSAPRRRVFIEQLVDSVRRVDYVSVVQQRRIDPERRNPHSQHFDPILGALLCRDSGEHDEACWLVFLAIHCGRHLTDGWKLAQLLYAGDGEGSEWTWTRVSTNLGVFRKWLDLKYAEWSNGKSRPKFGNHRKYLSLKGSGERGTGEVVETYVAWVLSDGDHSAKFERIYEECKGDRYKSFDALYHCLSVVQQFGRLARFDFLCMLGKCGLANIEPGHAYLAGSTGPKCGAELLFSGSEGSIHQDTIELGLALSVGMQVMEDALCNWVKDPRTYTRFRG